MNPLITATDLVQWADRRAAQGDFPLLVRRLVRASVNPLFIDFPGGDSVFRPGYDGTLRTAEGTCHVPAGQSVWEMGTNRDPQTKATKDYQTRTAKPGTVNPAATTFVFVTPRRYQHKAEWVAERVAEGQWADVRFYDADDLEQWLEDCPAVAIWARHQIGGLPEGIDTLEESWQSFSRRTSPNLSPGLLTAGRDAEVERVRQWLNSPPSCLRIRSNSAEEAEAFLGAVVQACDEELRETVHARAVVVSSSAMWRAVTGGGARRVVVTSCTELGRNFESAVRRGHHVALLYGNESTMPVDIDLPPLRVWDVPGVLREMGVGWDRSYDLARESRCRIPALVELMEGGGAQPAWAAPATAVQLVPFLLAGSWANNDADSEIVTRLGRMTRDEMDERLSRWANESDPPVRQVATTWEWVSRQRGWRQVARYVTAADLDALGEVAREVLGEDDPRLELQPDQRWAATLYNRHRRFSDRLRAGLAETYALLAGRSERTLDHANPANRANALVRDLFATPTDANRWYALADVLPLLAEAAPGAFLNAVEQGPVVDEAVRACLFQQEGTMGGSRIAHLLWALERLAWSADHLTRVTTALGALAACEHGGNSGNRPSNSLQAIHCVWRKHTAATAQQKLAVIRSLYRRYPAVAFNLCCVLALPGQQCVMPPNRPHHRDWAAGCDDAPEVPANEYVNTVGELCDLLEQWADDDQSRWALILLPIRPIGPEQFARFFGRLEALPLDRFAGEPSDELRRAVRDVLSRKRLVLEVYPELTADYITRLERVYERLIPLDSFRRDALQFAPDHDYPPENDWLSEQEVRVRARAEVVQRYIDENRLDDLPRLANVATDPWVVGYTAGQLLEGDESLLALLERGDEVRPIAWRTFDGGLLWGRFRRDGWEWVARLFAQPGPHDWLDQRKADFALLLPFEPATWDWVEHWGDDAAAAYWGKVMAWTDPPHTHAPRAVGSLLAHGRPAAAVRGVARCLYRNKRGEGLEPELLRDVLLAATTAATGQAPHAETAEAFRNLNHDLAEVLTAFNNSPIADPEELAMLELVWLQQLSYTTYTTTNLDRLMRTDPALFVDLHRVRSRPRPAEDEPEPELTGREQLLLEHGFRILTEWRGIPGADDEGVVDVAALRQWIDAARAAFREFGFDRVGDSSIGGVLARAMPRSADGQIPEWLGELLEDLDSDSLGRGFIAGIRNARGMTSHTIDEGGIQERRLFERYRAWADAAFEWPRLAEVMRQVADLYQGDAGREDNWRDEREFR